MLLTVHDEGDMMENSSRSEVAVRACGYSSPPVLTAKVLSAISSFVMASPSSG